jgi:hypothetical protein
MWKELVLLEHHADHGVHQLLLVLEMAEQGGLAHSHPIGYLPQGKGADAFAMDCSEGRFQYLPLSSLAVHPRAHFKTLLVINN